MKFVLTVACLLMSSVASAQTMYQQALAAKQNAEAAKSTAEYAMGGASYCAGLADNAKTDALAAKATCYPSSQYYTSGNSWMSSGNSHYQEGADRATLGSLEWNFCMNNYWPAANTAWGNQDWELARNAYLVAKDKFDDCSGNMDDAACEFAAAEFHYGRAEEDYIAGQQGGSE